MLFFSLTLLSFPVLSATNNGEAGVTNTMGFTADLKGDGQQERIDICPRRSKSVTVGGPKV
jgi:hypothetical protein